MAPTIPKIGYMWVAISLLLVDQLIKWLVVYYQPHFGWAHIGLALFSNPHSAFSLTSPAPWPLLTTLLFFLIILAVSLSFRHRPALSRPLSVMVAAASSNLLDRLLHGAVIDYLYLGSLFLNLADITLALAAGILLYKIVQSPR